MKNGPDISHIAALIGDPARANMLSALISGKALTATELAGEAGITPQTASFHLKKLVEGGLLILRAQGRHRYFAIADEDVADMLNALMRLAEKGGHSRTRTGPRDAAMRMARSCYNHLAGDMGVALFDFLLKAEHIALIPDGLTLTPSGRDFVRDFGIDLAALEAKSSPLCRDCLDWSARRSHLAGSLGRAFLTRFEELGWAVRDPDSRAILFNNSGKNDFLRIFEQTTV